MKLKTIFLLFFTLSCAPTIKNFSEYQKQFISKSEFMPDEQSLNGKIPKIAVLDFEDGGIETARQAALGKSVAKNVENIISKYRLAEIVDREATSKLQKEVQLFEMNKTGSYKGPKIADYIISGSISNASFANKYVSGSNYVNPKNGNLVSVPPKFVYSSDVSGNLKIYELPSLTVAQTIEIKGRSSRSENVQQDGGLSFGGLQVGGQQSKGLSRDDGLVRNAGADAIDELDSDIKNALAKKGYILEKRSLDKKSIFKINIGSEDGVRHGDKVEIVGQYEVENPLTGKSEIERRIITTAKVSDIIDPKACWIILDDKNKDSAIRIGDVVKIKYSKDTMKSIIKMAKNMAQ